MDVVGVMAAYAVILAKHCIELPDDWCLVIRNMLEQFQIFYSNSDCIYELYICASVGQESVLIVTDAR